MSSNNKIVRIVLSSMFLALALVMPFFTAQIPRIGSALCPMHFPVLLCGFLCGPSDALIVGFVAPLLRFLLFGMPPILPSGIPMSFELATYGVLAGLLYRLFSTKKINIYLALTGAMIGGRIVWALSRVVLFGLGVAPFSLELFIVNGFVNAIPGIIAQIVLIPVLVMSIRRNEYFR